MFGIGFSELLVILCIAVLLVRPKDLPKVFRMLGKLFGQVKSMYAEIMSTKERIIKDIDEIATAENKDGEKKPNEKG